MEREKSCKARWAEHKNSRFSDLRKLVRAYGTDAEDVPDLGSLHEYGLSFDYVAPNTFRGQPRGYWRYQLSWGGPSDEIRFYGDRGYRHGPERVEYVFQDWFDGYARKLRGRDEETARWLWDWFEECGSVDSEYERATAD